MLCVMGPNLQAHSVPVNFPATWILVVSSEHNITGKIVPSFN